MDAVLGLLARAPQLANYIDVTKLLDREVYSVLPSLLITTVALIYVSAARRNRCCPRYGKTLATKIVTALLLLLVETANVVLFCTSPAIRSKTTVATAIASCLSSVCLSLMVYAEKMYSFRPPGFLSLGLAVSILFDVTKARLYLERPELQTASGLVTGIYLLKSSLLLTEEAAKALAIRSQQPNRRITRNYWTQNLFLWLNATLVLGFRKVIKINDLLDMGPMFNSELLYHRFKPVWEKGKTPKYSKSTRIHLTDNPLPQHQRRATMRWLKPVYAPYLGISPLSSFHSFSSFALLWPSRNLYELLLRPSRKMTSPMIL